MAPRIALAAGEGGGIPSRPAGSSQGPASVSLSTVVRPCTRYTLFARLRLRASWPCALLLACVLVFGGAFAAEAPMPHAKATATQSMADAHCAGHDADADAGKAATPDGDCCGKACACAFAHAIGPLPGAIARDAFEPACPVASAAWPLHAKAAAPPLRPPIA